uniref:Uncharacterized protein n=1 Tax=Oryza meridionalis TaxID=40149 RepID=A0A0E0CNH2_9ORYZ
MVAAGLVAAATLDPARANLRVEAGRSGAVVEAGGVQGARATVAGGRGGDRRRRGAGLAAAGGGRDWRRRQAEAATGGGVWAAVVKAAAAESATSGITGSASTIAGSGARCGRGGGWQRGCGGGGDAGGSRSRGGVALVVVARGGAWRRGRWCGGWRGPWRCGRRRGVEAGLAAWSRRGDAASSGRPVPHVEARPAAWRLATARGCAAGDGRGRCSTWKRGRRHGWLAELRRPQGNVGNDRLRRGLNACETSWTIVWPSMWGACVDAGESLAVPLAGSMTTTPLAPFPFLKALSWRSAICPTNLQVKTLLRPRTSGDDVTRRVLLGGVASGKFLTSMTIDGPFGSKAFFPWHSARPKPLGSASFYGGRHTLRLLLRMKLELLAVGVRRRLATMTCCSLFQRVGAGHVEEVALWWLG